jgi:hypothetical protein
LDSSKTKEIDISSKLSPQELDQLYTIINKNDAKVSLENLASNKENTATAPTADASYADDSSDNSADMDDTLVIDTSIN